MAYVQSRRRAASPDSPDNKENQPPKKRKRVEPSVNDLLKKSKSKHRTARDVLAPLPVGISKKAKAQDTDFFKRFSKKRINSDDDPLRVAPGFFRKIDQDKEQERALDTGYADAAHAYCEGAASEAKRRVDHFRAELDARRQGLDLDGQPLHRKGHPSKADFDNVFAQMNDLAKPLEDEMIDVEFRDAATGQSQFRQLRVGSTLDKFFERHTRKRGVVAEIASEVRQVEAEITKLVEQIQKEKEAMEKNSAEVEAEIAELRQDLEGVENDFKTEMQAFRRTLKADSDEVNKKIEELKAYVGS
ncbi:uncharacterized protein RCC_10362 [Ramularia collo-cygni]|uniref:Uncharacterized protein n=1 Tax=Ramularia collo-cygni TaxID=112498 RepID=A0A2D3V2Z3_9PEZI|nr:uncharacterized protein RCC_10362 [Ramularia collo-cygni]CZT24637.1 uncharacterized protein RCC_10362 [Ramularia collo-cygni]